MKWIEFDRITLFGGDLVVFSKDENNVYVKLECINTFHPATAISNGNYIELRTEKDEDYYYVITQSNDPHDTLDKIRVVER